MVIAGTRDEATAESQAMAPPPGHAPQEPIAIIFDGGTRGDPARGYGSYSVMRVEHSFLRGRPAWVSHGPDPSNDRVFLFGEREFDLEDREGVTAWARTASDVRPRSR